MADANQMLASDCDEFRVEFPQELQGLTQDKETFEFTFEGRCRRLEMHDYSTIYQVPGLYEAVVYRKLGCQSPEKVIDLFASVLGQTEMTFAELNILDLGAGNGIVGTMLRRHGAKHIVGLDILDEAKAAPQRDSPGVYDDYVVADLANLSSEEEEYLSRKRFDALITVAALGFGDIPPHVFASAFNLISPGGYVALAIKEDFLNESVDASGFAGLFQKLVDDSIIAGCTRQRFIHRKTTDTDNLYYEAIVGRKVCDIPHRLV
jgi:2-polyprenyl-3-methyl-5-hydroxy-6-metoxy-1,4-benzoquinol methylase